MDGGVEDETLGVCDVEECACATMSEVLKGVLEMYLCPGYGGEAGHLPWVRMV